MERLCACTGIRFCAKCEENSYRASFADMLPVGVAQGMQVKKESGPTGLSLIENFITETEEDQLVKHLIVDAGWKPS